MVTSPTGCLPSGEAALAAPPRRAIIARFSCEQPFSNCVKNNHSLNSWLSRHRVDADVCCSTAGAADHRKSNSWIVTGETSDRRSHALEHGMEKRSAKFHRRNPHGMGLRTAPKSM
jgi:hypothetical protein